MNRAINMEDQEIKRINPQLFSLWVGMASMIMLFMALTSAYIVKQAAGNWLEFQVPTVFYASTVSILLSSFTLHAAYKAFLNGKESAYKSLLVVSLILGVAFVGMQYIGWNQLFNMGVDFRLNVSGSFFYLITGAHAAHVLGGIAAIIVALIHAFSLKYKVTEKRKTRFQLTLHYWHFVDVLWIYLLLFLLFIK